MAGKAHIEAAAKPKEAKAYCMKKDTRIDGPWEIGTCEETRGGDHKSATFG